MTNKMKNTKSILFLAVTMMLVAPILFVSGTACAQSDLLMLESSPLEGTPESAFTFTVKNLDETYSISNYGGTTGVRYAGRIYARALDINDAEIVEITTCSGSRIENFEYLTLGPVRYLNNNDNEFEIWGRELCEKVYGENSLCNGRIEFWAKEIRCANAPGATPGRSGYSCCCDSDYFTCENNGRESNHIIVTINNGNVCSDECDYAGQTRCYDANFAQTCGNYDSDSCLEWSSTQICGANHVCENGICVEECTSHYDKKCYSNDLYWYDSCNNKQEKYEECGSDYWTNNYQCSGNWTQREKVEQGCSDNTCESNSVWENYEDCSSTGKSCVGGVCVEQGQDECDYIGQARCYDSTSRQVCGNYDSDSWLEWSSPQNCGANHVCENGICVEQGQDECSYVNQHECSGTSGRTCGNYDSDSWLEWSSWNNCDTQCYHCGNGTCDSQCGETSYSCSNDCGSPYYPINHAPSVNAGANKETYETESVVLQGYANDSDGDSMTYSWSCNGGRLSNPNIAQPVFYAPSISGNSAIYTCTLTVFDNKGLNGADSMNVLVKEHQSPTIHMSLSTNPNSGVAPLNNVDLRASLSGTATGNVTYFFDCTNDGTWERIVSSNNNSYTADNLCNYASEGTYTAKARAERDNLSIEAFSVINLDAPEPLPEVDIKANNSDGPITIPYNTSATLKWTSSDVSYCFASGDWDGSKALASNSWSTGDLTSSKTYTIGCRNKKGVSIVDTVVVNVASEQQENSVLVIEKIARNVSDNTSYGSSISADPGEIIAFTITVKAIDGDIDNIIVKDTLPHNISYTGNLKVSGKDSTGNIFTGLDIGHISEGKKRTITFTAKVAEANNFNFGETSLINACIAYNTEVSVLDTAKVVVNRKSVLGAATSIKTGAINPIQFALLASLLVSTLLIISLFILHKFLYPRSFAWQKMVDKYQNLRFYVPFLP